MTDTINEARALARGLRATGNPLVAKMVEDVADECERLRADLEAAQAELAAARAAMPTAEVQRLLAFAVRHVNLSLTERSEINTWLRHLDAYHAAHPAASPCPVCHETGAHRMSCRATDRAARAAAENAAHPAASTPNTTTSGGDDE